MATPEQIAALRARIREIERRLVTEREQARTAQTSDAAVDVELDRLERAAARGNFDNATAEGRAARDAALAAADRYRAEVAEPAARRVRETSRALSQTEAQLQEVQRQLTVAEQAAQPAPQPAPPATAAETVRDDAPAGPTAPPQQTVGTDGRISQPTNTGTTNAAAQPTGQTPAGTELGTDAPVKTTEQTQAINTNSNSGQATPAPGAAGTTAPPGGAVINPGVSGAKDDAPPRSTRTVQNTVDAGGNDDVTVVPQPNVLDDYYSYSYSASVYLLTEPQYERLQNSKNKTVDGYYLLFQSGGAPNNNGGVRPPPSSGQTDPADGQVASAPTAARSSGPDGGRNPFFPDDYYIDSISIKSVIAGKATGAAHNAAELKFTVIEPAGITLLDNLYKAVQNISPKDAAGKVNYTAVTYLMVIRFYGYDQDGNQVQVAAKVDAEGTSDRTAIVEKFIPFKIANINWSVGSKLVSYEWDCTPASMMIAAGTVRGTIPNDVQLVNSTVGGLLGNNRVTVANSSGDENQNETNRLLRQQSAAQSPSAQNRLNENDQTTQNANSYGDFTNTQERGAAPAASSPAAAKPPPATANAAASKKIVSGLMAAMNEHQQSLVKRGIYTTGDVYSIEFVGPGASAISGARLQLPNAKVDKKQTAAGDSPAQAGGKALDQRAQAVDMVSRNFSITAGQQLLQVIEQVIRNSSYITDQALVVLNPDGTYTSNPKANPNKPMKWFEISMSATAIGDKIDPRRNDFAYNIKYVVRQKIIPNFDSKYFPVSTFSGVHKSYPYWFTGQNTAVMEYQETLNALYHVTVSGDAKVGEDRTNREQFTSSLADVRKYAYSPRSNASSQQAKGKEFELGANAAEVIYSPGDLAETKVKIIGDPAWIQQGSLFRDAEQIISTSTGFDPDGSISFDSVQPMFEIVWQRPQDYDIDTGLADPYSTQPAEFKRSPQQSRVYVTHTVTSDFEKGAFTQQLEGALYLFPVPGKDKPVVKPAESARKAPVKTKSADASRAADQDTLARNQAATARYDASNEFSGLSFDQPTTSAATAGAQGSSRPAPGPSAASPGQLGSGTFATPSGTAPSGRLGSGTFSGDAARPAGPPKPPTSGTNTPLTAPTTGSAPQRLPPSPGAVNTANRAAAAQGSSTRSPNTPTDPANQDMAKTT